MDVYNELLNATIAHLKQLKVRGVRYVAVTPDVLAGLTSASAQRTNMAPSPAIAMAKEIPPLLKTPERRGGVTVSHPGGPAGDKAAGMQELRERALVCQKCL